MEEPDPDVKDLQNVDGLGRYEVRCVILMATAGHKQRTDRSDIRSIYTKLSRNQHVGLLVCPQPKDDRRISSTNVNVPGSRLCFGASVCIHVAQVTRGSDTPSMVGEDGEQARAS